MTGVIPLECANVEYKISSTTEILTPIVGMENLVFDAQTGIITVTLNMGDFNFLNQFTNDIL
jgi:hypothetical protein